MKAGPIIAAVFMTIFGLVFVLAGSAVIALGFTASGGSADEAPWYVFVPFGLVFVGAGSFVIWMGWRAPREAARAAKDRDLYAAEPWKQVKEWRSSRLADDAGQGTWFFWGFALFWNFITITALGIGWEDMVRDAAEEPAMYGILIFPLVGLGLLIAAVRGTIRARKFPSSALTLSVLPVPPGGTLDGVLELPESLRRAERIVTRLSCYRITRSGKNTHTTTLWQDEQERSAMELTSDGLHALLHLHIGIPRDAHLSTFEGGTPRVEWRLDVTASVPGVDYHASFKVPVYGAVPDVESLETNVFSMSDSSVRPLQAGGQPGERTVPMGMSLDGGMEWDFRPARLPGPALAISAFTFVWLGVTVFLAIAEDVPLMFPIVFGFFGLLLLYGLYDLWLARILLQVQNGALIRKTGPVVTIRYYRCERDDISDFTVRPGMSVGSRAYHDIHVKLKSGKKLRIGSHLRSLREAEMIVREVKEALGIAEA